MRSQILLAMIVAAPAAAQRQDSTKTLPDTTKVVELAPIQVHGSIAPTAGPGIGSGIPARVSTVTGQEIDAWEPRLLADALATQAGISIYDDVGSPFKVSLTTRGFAAGPVVGLPQGISVFLDGVRQNEPDAAEVNFDLLPMEHVQRVELLSGTGSLLGPNSLGGAVNLITNRGGGPPEAELELSGGSFGSYSGEGSISGSSREWSYYAGGGYENEDGWRNATGAHDYNVFGNIGRQGTDRGVSLQLFGAKSVAKTAGSLPESSFHDTPRLNFTPGDFEDLDKIQIALSGYHPVAGGRGAATAYFRTSGAERFNVNQAPDPNVRGFSDIHVFGATADWRMARRLGGGTLSFRAGADGVVNRIHLRLYTEDPGSGARDLTTDIHSPSWDLAGYTIADWQLGRVVISGGVRYDVIRVPFRDALDPAADATSTFRRLSPRGGVSVRLGGGTSAYVSAGQSFRAPALVELTCADAAAPCPLPFALGDDPPLDPVIATTVEAGGRWVRGPAVMDLSAYRTAVRNDIYFIASDAASFAGYFNNIGDTRREGVELSTRLLLPAGHSLYANYAYTLATFRTAATLFSPREAAGPASGLQGDNAVVAGDRLPLVPAHQVRAGGLVYLGHGLRAGLDLRYVGHQWLRGDEANQTSTLDDYVTTDVQLGADFGRWELTGILSNAFDAAYASFGTFNENRNTGEVERFLTPGQPRAVKVIVRRQL